jgi:glycine hydroxymethyltransferase
MAQSEITRTTVSAEDVMRVAWQEDPVHAAELVASLTDMHNSWHEHSLNLVASHNVISPKAKAILRSNLIENISSGAIGTRSHTGTILLDRIDSVLVELAKRLFGIGFVEHRAPSGDIANGLFILGAMEPGERVMSLFRRYGGHHTSWDKGSYVGVRGVEIHEIPCYGEDYPVINLELLADEMERIKPNWLIVGSDTMLFPYPMEQLLQLADIVGAKIYYDGAHILGLAPAEQFQDPLHEGAVAMTGSTQKTLPGPVGGLILIRDAELAQRVLPKVSRFLTNYNNSRTAALAVTLAEMLAFGKAYASAVVQNAQALARALDEEGLVVVGKDRGFTQSHVVLVDMTRTRGGIEALHWLEAAHIACTPTGLPKTHPTRGALRLGSAACTRKGMTEGEMKEVARLIRRVVVDREDPITVGRDVALLASSFTEVHYCF